MPSLPSDFFRRPVAFELRSLVQNALLGLGAVRNFLHRRGSTGMNGDPTVVRAQFDAYRRHVDVTGKEILELGPGHTPDVLALAVEAGAKRGIGLDTELHVDPGPFRTRGVELVTYDGDRIPFPDASFDIVWSTDVLEHVRDPKATIVECFRVLRPGGLLLAAVDLRDHYFLDREAQWFECLKYPDALWFAMTSNRSSFVNRLRTSEWKALLDQVGFERLEYVERTSSVLEANHRRSPVRRAGQLLRDEDASVYRIDFVVRRPAS